MQKQFTETLIFQVTVSLVAVYGINLLANIL
jgi:hypothetical protein